MRWIVHTDALLVIVLKQITPSISQFVSPSVNILTSQKYRIWDMFSGYYYDLNYSRNKQNTYTAEQDAARQSSSSVYPVVNSVFPINQASELLVTNYGRDMISSGSAHTQSTARSPAYHNQLLVNTLNNRANYFLQQSTSSYVPPESNLVLVSPSPQSVQYDGYIAGLNSASYMTPTTGYKAGLSHREMSDMDLKEEIRASIMQQINIRHQYTPSVLHVGSSYTIPNKPVDHHHTNQTLASNNTVLTEAKKRQKRPSSTNEDVGGKKQRFVDNRFRNNTPNTSGGGGTQSISPNASTSQSNRRGSYHDTGSHFPPDHLLRRAISSKDPCEKLTKAIINYFLENQQTNEVFDRKMKLRDALFSVIHSVFPHSGLYIVGSSMSGFGTKKSDMDMCLMISLQGIDQKKEATDLLYALQRALRKCSFVKNLEVIRAKVPILRFRDKVSDVECDLNVNNLVGIRNTHLLKHYAQSDWRIRPLGLFIKYWARSQNINDARNMTISSYSFALMMIHYLQCGCAPPVLPALQVKYSHDFNSRTDVRQLKPVTFTHQSPNTLSVGELFLGFLEYFSFTFDYRNDAISVRLGKTLSIRDVQKQTSDYGRQWSCLCIEEPFDLTNTARSVYNHQIFQQVHRAFRTSFTKLNKGKDIKEVLKQNT